MTLHANEVSPEEIQTLSDRFETFPLTEILGWAWERFGNRAAVQEPAFREQVS